MTDLQKIRQQRRKDTAEDFTPLELVNEMLDKLPAESFSDPTKTFIDPAAGDGNFLVVVLDRKLAAGHPPLQALSTVFGVELMPDNVEEMKERLFNRLPSLTSGEARRARDIIDYNIRCHDALTWDYENWKPTNQKAKALF